MIVEKQMECRLAGETEVLGENLPQRHFSALNLPEITPKCLTVAVKSSYIIYSSVCLFNTKCYTLSAIWLVSYHFWSDENEYLHGHHVLKIKIHKTTVSHVIYMDMKLVFLLEVKT
jgi:hypothetical protein